MKKIIVIIGPTGVGKTKLGVELAKHYDGEIISGDSMQIYKGMDVGTAKVTKQEAKGIVHHLIDIKDPKENYSVKEFQDNVRSLIEDITARKKLPILVGGTGLYIKAALYDYDFKESVCDHEFYKQKYQDYSNQELYQHLLLIDKESATSLHPNNRQRVLRAIEVFETTGVKKSETIAKQQHVCLYDALFIGLTLEREVLYQRINERVDRMIQQGLKQEIHCLISNGCDESLQSMKAIGYKEWFPYFRHEISYKEMIETIKKHSRNYAKRQYTWFYNQLNVSWIEVNLDCFNKTIEQAIKKIDKGN